MEAKVNLWREVEAGTRFTATTAMERYPQLKKHSFEGLSSEIARKPKLGNARHACDVMTYLVVNPYWNVPESIAIKDILPSAREDSTYLADKGIRVFDSWGASATEIPRDLIDWSSLNDGNFRYRFIQDPGAKNSLGRI